MFIFHFDLIGLLTLVVGVLLPLLVGVVTVKDTHPGSKALLLLLFSIAATVIGQVIQALQTGHPFDVFAALLYAVATFLIGAGTHFGFWKPLGVSNVMQTSVGRRSPHALKNGS